MTIVDKNPNWWQFLTKIQSCEAQRRRPGRGGRPRRALLGGRAGEGGGGGAGGRGQAEDRWELGWQWLGGWGGVRWTMAEASTLTWSAELDQLLLTLITTGSALLIMPWYNCKTGASGADGRVKDGKLVAVRVKGLERVCHQLDGAWLLTGLAIFWKGSPLFERWHLACASSTTAWSVSAMAKAGGKKRIWHPLFGHLMLDIWYSLDNWCIIWVTTAVTFDLQLLDTWRTFQWHLIWP